MPDKEPLSREAFLGMASGLELTADDAHMDELYEYVKVVLSGLESLKDIDVSRAEPDMAFIPPKAENSAG